MHNVMSETNNSSCDHTEHSVTQAAQTHYMNADVTLACEGVVLQTVIYKSLYGIDRFFLNEIKNVMFLNKIDVPYCLVVFFVVCPRLRPF